MTVVLLQLSVSLPMLLPVLQAAHFHAPSLAKRGRVGEGRSTVWILPARIATASRCH